MVFFLGAIIPEHTPSEKICKKGTGYWMLLRYVGMHSCVQKDYHCTHVVQSLHSVEVEIPMATDWCKAS